MRYALSVGASVAALLSLCLPVSAAEDASPGTAQVPTAAAPAEKPPELTQEERAEKEARMACKAKICKFIATAWSTASPYHRRPEPPRNALR